MESKSHLPQSLSIIIPAHNEGAGIYQTLMEIDGALVNLAGTIIFVTEDGSKDNTRDEVARAANSSKNSKIILASPADRLGYSKAVQRGINDCETELICFMDADGQYDPVEIHKLLEKVTDTGIVIGYRSPRKDGLNRTLYSSLFGIVYRLLGGPKRKDPSSPFLIAHTNEIKSLGQVNCHLSFGFWWEFQWRIEKLGLKYVEVPVTHRVRSAGATQVYTLNRLPKIIRTHLLGLYELKRELS